jgi:hypothetical protein
VFPFFGAWADQIKESEVGRACGTHGRGEKRVRGFGGREKTTWKTKASDGRIVSKSTLCRLVGGVEWIQLAQDRVRWWAVVNAMMMPRVLALRN